MYVSVLRGHANLYGVAYWGPLPATPTLNYQLGINEKFTELSSLYNMQCLTDASYTDAWLTLLPRC